MPTPHCDNSLDGMVEIQPVFEILDNTDAHAGKANGVQEHKL
jgi:hypothetical protein